MTDKKMIARRFLNLPQEKRKTFLAVLKEQGIDFGKLPIVPNAESQEPCLPSYAQSRQWFLWQLQPEGTAYHLSGALRLKGDLDIKALESSFNALVARHESLRTLFRTGVDGQAEQCVQQDCAVSVQYIDLRALPEPQRTTSIHDAAVQLHRKPFDLEVGPLLRLGLIRDTIDEYILVVVMHHIVSDGWSMQIIVREFAEHYGAKLQGVDPRLPELPIQYRHYAVWQRNWLEAGEKARQLEYWKSQLGDDNPTLQLPTDHARQPNGIYSAANCQIELPIDVIDSVRELAQRHGATLFVVLLAGVQILLHRYTGQNDIRVGVPIANRQRAETEGVVGFFVNTQVLRNVIDGRMSLHRVLSQAKDAALGAQNHQDLPFEQLVEALQPERNSNVNPLFQVMHNHERQEADMLKELPGLQVQDYMLDGQEAQFELTLDTVEDAHGRVRANFTYASELFDSETVERMARHYLAVLRAFAYHPEQAVRAVEMLDAADRQSLRAWGVNSQSYSSFEPVHRMFERQVQNNPCAAALLFDNERITYFELNRRANRLAHRLIALGVKQESKVGVAVERSIEMVVGLLAILKAGGAYVPLDTEYPPERLAYMVDDSEIGLILTQSWTNKLLPANDSVQLLELDTPDLADGSEHDPRVDVHGDNLAYIIYTSGSTGKPKGAAIRHQSLAACMTWMQHTYRLTRDDTVLHKAPFGFDVSVWEIIWPLTAGVPLVVANPGDHRDPKRITELICRHQVTTLNFVPAMLQAFLELENIEAQTRLRYVMCGGEAMSASLQSDVLGRLRSVSLQNLYGPTETTIHVTQWNCRLDWQRMVPIGRPISSTEAYVLDGSMSIVPPGVVGELYIGGGLLARGYLGRPALSAERFIASPLSDRGARMYRTGDLVRWNAEGQLEYLGRIDHQIKIRGLRVELGEVEKQLMAQPEVREAVVVASENLGGTRLLGYISVKPNKVVDASQLRKRLGMQLPDYMVPSGIVILEMLPLNANGKVDRKALPEVGEDENREYEAPQGDIEETLAAIWAEVLGVTRVGRHDNFFELGGHSITALQVIAKARQKAMAGLEVSLQDFMKNPTIKRVPDDLKPIVELNKVAGDSAPLFCVHSGFGTVLGYLPIAKMLAGKRQVHGLVCRTLIDPKHRDESLQAMAAEYAQWILKIQPTGAYHLLGWSLGGPLAALIAACLEAAGKEVHFLGLVDPTSMVTSDRDGPSRESRWQELFIDFIRQAAGDDGLSIAVPENIGDPLEDESSVIDWVAKNISDNTFRLKGEYIGVSAENIVRVYLTIRCLSLTLNRSEGTLRKLKCSVFCWWAKDRPDYEIGPIVAEMGGSNVNSINLPSDHASIIKSDLFLHELTRII